MSFPIIVIKHKTEDFPRLLSQIAGPPKQLYCRGNIKLLNSFCLGVVGTRKVTAYGKEATEHIVSGLAGSGITIVSGLAFGVDTVAHETALDNNLPTIAVLGSGVSDNRIGPRTNLPIAQDILKNNGLIISEFPDEEEVYPMNFAKRDRVISGLSRGVLVIEAGEKSGALITAQCAADQDRDVFALPGNIFATNSRGPNMLIQKGAKPVFSADDILGHYYQNLELNLASKNDISTKNPNEKKILAILEATEGITADEIINSSGLEASLVISGLSMLELKNKIKQRSGKYELV